MACLAIAVEPITLRFASLQREAQNKHAAPFAGFSIPGQAPVVVPRKLLKAALEGLTDARVTVEFIKSAQSICVTANGDGKGPAVAPDKRPRIYPERWGLAISSPDGRRRYVLYSRQPELRIYRSDEQKAVAQFAARKRGTLARSAGWKHANKVNEETGDISRWSEKAGLAVRGSVIYHAASGKSVGTCESNALAFVAAEKILAKHPDWTQDAESVLAMVGTAGGNEIRNICAL